MHDFLLLGYLLIKFTISILKFMVILLISLANLLFFLNFLNTIPCWYASVKMLFLLHLISLSIFLTNSAASLGFSVFLIDCSNPLVSISSSLLLMIDSRNFNNTWSLFDFGRFWFHQSLKTKNNKNYQLLSTKFLSVLLKLCRLSFSQFCSNFVPVLFKSCAGFIQIL